jgi:hypothetical protein
MCVLCSIEAHSRNHCCHGKTLSITHFEYVFVALVVQDAKGLCCVMLSVASLAPQHDFWEKVMEYKMCVLVSSTLFVGNISHPKNLASYYQKCVGLHVKYLLFLSDFNET